MQIALLCDFSVNLLQSSSKDVLRDLDNLAVKKINNFFKGMIKVTEKSKMPFGTVLPKGIGVNIYHRHCI